MRKLLLPLIAALSLALPSGMAQAELAQGARAPAVRTTGALAGRTFRFDLAHELRRGPVVIYFFPRAFTAGCTAEAHAFAEAMPEFRAAGAQVIGLSADDIVTLQRFSTEECRDAFPVGQATRAIIRNYDVALHREDADTGLTERTSYVIAPSGRIVMVHADMDWREHVSRTLAAVRALQAR